VDANILPAYHEAQENLTTFRNDFLPWFPFAYIPPELTASELRKTRPFFHLSIMAVCSRSPKERNALQNQVRQSVLHQIATDGAGSIDLVLCLITFVAWFAPLHPSLNDR
jgi:hypothetical protein